MRTVSPQQQHGTWTRVGLVADRLPVALEPYARPSVEPVERRCRADGVGVRRYVGVPPRHDTAIQAAREGLPEMSEARLMLAHRNCACQSEAQETHTLAEWDAIETAQRAFAGDARAVADETADIERAERQAL